MNSHMADRVQETVFGISVSKIALTRFELYEELNIDQGEKLDFNVDFYVQIFFNSTKNFVKFELRTEFKLKSEPNITFLKARISTTYMVEELKTYIELKDGREFMSLPDPLMMSLLSMSTSHARAKLSVHTANSKFSNCYLPIVDSKKLLKQLKDKEQKTSKSE